MADIVWSTLELYGIQNKVRFAFKYKPARQPELKLIKIMAIMMDNASNNDMMMEAIEN